MILFAMLSSLLKRIGGVSTDESDEDRYVP